MLEGIAAKRLSKNYPFEKALEDIKKILILC
jgi:hypothetical protein